jgi:hypothetical protein
MMTVQVEMQMTLILRPRFIETLYTIALHLIFNSLLSALVYGQ